MKRSKVTGGLGVVMCMMLVAALAHHWFSRAELTLLNTTDQPLKVAVRWDPSPSKSKVAWYSLEPSGILKIPRFFFRREPNFRVVATTDADYLSLNIIEAGYSPKEDKYVPGTGQATRLVWDDPEQEPEGVPQFSTEVSEKSVAAADLCFEPVAVLRGRALKVFSLDGAVEVTASRMIIVNATPLHLRAQYAFPTGRDDWRTESGSLEPGGTLEVRHVFRAQLPEYYTVLDSETQDAGLVAEIETRLGRAGTSISWESEDGLTLADNPLNPYGPPLVGPKGGAGRGLIHVPFGEGADSAMAVRLPGVAGSDDLAADCGEAILLREALARTAAWRRATAEGGVVFYPGLGFDTADDPLHMGALVASTQPKIPQGPDMQIWANDTLLSLGGRSVFCEADAYSAVHWHALDRLAGIEKPVAFTAERASDGGWSVVAGGTSYWIDKAPGQCAFFGCKEVTAGDALINGALDGPALGFQEELRAGAAAILGSIADGLAKLADSSHVPEARPDYAEIRWALAQQEGCYRQWFPDSRKLGEISSLFVSPTQIAARAVTRGAARRAATGFVAQVGFEVGEQFIQARIADPTLLQTAKDRDEEVRRILLTSVVKGALPSFPGKSR